MGAAASQQPDVVVVGGGAAGLFASIAAARAGASVLCLESGSQPLRKVKVSGGGRCNVMHDPLSWQPASAKELLAGRYPRGSQELISPLLSGFSPTETAAWFRAEGIELKREADGRVFPATDSSQTVIDALLAAAERAGVRLITSAKVEAVARCHDGGLAAGEEAAHPGGFALTVLRRGGAASEEVRCASLVLATGSASHHLAACLGHEPSPLLPSLFAFRLAAGALLDASLAGLSVADAQLTFEPLPSPPPAATASSPQPAPAASSAGAPAAPEDGSAGGSAAPAAAPAKKARAPKGGSAKGRGALVSARGPLLVTHRGLSGPAALRLSAHAAVELAAAGYKGHLVLNLCPDVPAREVGAALAAFRQGEHRLKQVGTVSPFELPRRLWRAVVAAAAGGEVANGAEGGVDPTRRWEELSASELRGLEARLTRLRLPFSGKDSNKEEFVTCGGVRLHEVRMKDMRSKKEPALFFAGELLDIDGITGGHNFQSCWTTGYLAGRAAAEAALSGAVDGTAAAEVAVGAPSPRDAARAARRGK